MKRLIVCADGTWNRPDEKSKKTGKPTPTNVEKLHEAVPHVANGIAQVAHYESGVGTGNLLDRLFGGAIGKGIDRHIRNCYQFLVDEYEKGDEIYLFGFSRGAYTARSLAGLIRNSGILRPEHRSLIDEAFDIYRSRDPKTHPRGEDAQEFRNAHSYWDVDNDGTEIDSTKITCVGVWDTVGALGIPLELFQSFNELKYQFHDTSLSGRVKNAFHALAIDERRKPFAPTLWEQPLSDAQANINWLEQAWFTGCHSDVGGGNETSQLSDIAFMWMIDRVQERTDLRFDNNFLKEAASPDFLGQLNESMNDFYEKLGPINRKLDDIEARKRANPNVNTWEYVHVTANERYERTKTQPQPWMPENFIEYIRRDPHLIAERRVT
jgi:uncharacterized protein (DUF2235 family)